MEKNQLKLLAASFIKESDIEKDAKVELLKFVKNEATESQIQSLILDGEILHLSEQAQAVVADRFSVFVKEHKEAINEALTDREKTFIFGRIQRMFGECAKKCGRITIFSKANACKDMCIAKRDQAIKAARAKAKGQAAKAKEIESY